MTRLTAPWLTDPRSQAVCRMLTDAGHRALFVGGCVRNTLLDQPVSDIDLSTDAVPEAVMQLAADAGLKPVPTGIDHGTVTVVSGGLPHEITTFRHDVETDGRRAVVAYTDRVEEDARRRDFTMNALYAEGDGTLVDPLGGYSDLRARRVRFIEDAHARITEDYLRILRFFRFHAWYGDPQGGLDADGLAACAALSDGLETLSRERVGAEMIKLLSAPDPAPSVASMAVSGCLARVLPGSDPRALPLLINAEARMGVPPDPVRRLAVLGGADRAERLRLSKRQARQLALIDDNTGSPAPPAELAYRHGAPAAMDIVLARCALLETPLPAGVAAQIETGQAARFPVKSADIGSDFQGPALGSELRRLEQRWIRSGFALTRDDLLRGPEGPGAA